MLDALWDLQARMRLGWPKPGGLVTHGRNTFYFEEGAELAERLGKVFGDLSRLACMDLGCGPGETPIARHVLEIPWRRLISIDAFPPYLSKLRQKEVRARQHTIQQGTIGGVTREFGSGEVDIVLLIDVIEHLRRREALRTIVALEAFARRGVAVFCPLGKVEQDELDGNALQRHRSAWTARDWARLGYEVEVYEGFHGHLKPSADAAWAIKKK